MSDISAALGNGPPLIIGGKTYHLTPLTKKAQADFEDWAKQYALKQANFIASEYPPEIRLELIKYVYDQFSRGEYKFGGERLNELMSHPEACAFFFYLIIKPKHPELTEETANNLFWEYTEEIAEAMGSLYPKNAEPPELNPGENN